MSELFVDVTQFSRQPARSGVQRALGEMARAWPTEGSTWFVARVAGQVLAVRPDRFARAVDEHFADGGAEEVLACFAGGRAPGAAALDAGAWLLPEPTYDAEVLGDLTGRARRKQRVSGIAFDCFPQTHPWAFPGNGQAATSPYFRFLAGVPTAIATSAEVGAVLTDRLRRERTHTPVVWLGTDHETASRVPGVPVPGRFLIVGTVEPRKRFALAVEAVALLQQSVPHARLVLVGRPGCAEPSFLRRLRRLHERGGLLEWHSDASDHDLAELMATSVAMLAIGDEGFGLPVVEAAKRGCPTLYGGVQPAAGLLADRGSWRVDTTSPSALARDLEPWCDAAYAQERRGAVNTSGLPSWAAFSREVHALVV